MGWIDELIEAEFASVKIHQKIHQKKEKVKLKN